MSRYSNSRIADNFPDDMNWHRFDQKYSDGGCANEQAIEDGFEGFRGGLCFDCAYEDDCPDYEDYQEYQDLKEEQEWGAKSSDEIFVMCPFCEGVYVIPRYGVAGCPFCEIEKVGVETVKNSPFKVGDLVITHDLTDSQGATFKNAIKQGEYRLYRVHDIVDFSHSAKEFYKLFPNQTWNAKGSNVRYHLEPVFHPVSPMHIKLEQTPSRVEGEEVFKRKWYSKIRMRKFNKRKHGTAKVIFVNEYGCAEDLTYDELKERLS